jgi:hypothetical protein
VRFAVGGGAGDDSTRAVAILRRRANRANAGARGSRHAARSTAETSGEVPSGLGLIMRLTLLMQVIRTHWRLELNRYCQMSMIFEYKFDLICSTGPIPSLPVG